MNQQELTPKEVQKKKLNSYAKYSGVAFQMVVVILLGVFGGIKADNYFGMKFPLFTIIFSLLGVILAIYYAVKDLLKFK